MLRFYLIHSISQQRVVYMKWYQAHVRVMAHLFKLGLFDKVNTSYRNFCMESNPSAKDQLIELVSDEDIKLYCEALSEKKLAGNKLTTQNIVNYYYKATTCFVMFKALQKVAGKKLAKLSVIDDMPNECYQELFVPNGQINDDVIIKACTKQDFTYSPKEFVSSFLNFKVSDYLNGDSFALPELPCNDSIMAHFIREQNGNYACELAQKVISPYLDFDDEGDDSDHLAVKKAKAKGINYFDSDAQLETCFGLLKVIDLLGMHLLLVAQRRQYLFQCYRYDDLRSNYEALTKVNSQDIVRLHCNAVIACSVFEETRENLLSINSRIKDINCMVKAYVGLNDALYQYICYFYEFFVDLLPNEKCTNLPFKWEVGFYFYNLYEPFKLFSALQANLLVNVNNLLRLDLKLATAMANPISYDKELVNILTSGLPANIYELCAHFAPSFANTELSHPKVVNFEEIVNSVMSYGQSLNYATPKLPYVIKKDSEFNVDDNGNPNWLKRESYLQKISEVHERLARDVINDPQPMVFSRKLNLYLDIFCFASVLVELCHNFYFRTLCFSAVVPIKGEKACFDFDLTHCDTEWTSQIYESYQELLKDEALGALMKAHKACLEHLILILDLQGDSNLLYEDRYLSNLLRKTNNYDQELADNLASNKDSSNKPALSKVEQLLLNKTSISFLQECQNIINLCKDLINNNSQLDMSLNNQQNKFIFVKEQIFSGFYNLCGVPVKALMKYLMFNLDNVPEDLKLNAGISPSNVLSKESNQSDVDVNHRFYQGLYEVLLAMRGKDINIFSNEIVPYIDLATKDDFSRSLNSVHLFIQDFSCKSANYIIFFAYKRLIQSVDYNSAIKKQICKNTLFANSALCFIVPSNALCVKYIMISLAKVFAKQVLSYTKVKQVEEHSEYLNMLYNVVHKAFKFDSNNFAKIKNLIALSDQDTVVLSEQFEYKSYLGEVVDVLKMMDMVCCNYSQYNDKLFYISDLGDIESFIALFHDLSVDSTAVLERMDDEYFDDLDEENGFFAPYFTDNYYIAMSAYYIRTMLTLDEELNQRELLVVGEFFGGDLRDFIEEEQERGSGDPGAFLFSLFNRRHRELQPTKTQQRFINLVKDKVQLLADEELYNTLNLESNKASTQIVDSSSTAKAKASNKAKAKAKAKAKGTTTKSKADSAVAASEDTAAEVKKATRSTRAKKDDKAEAVAEASSEPKAKTTTKATATKSRAKKVDSSIKIGDDPYANVIIEPLDAIEDKPQKKATRAKKASTVTATAKATATKSRAKKVATATSTEANANSATKATDAKPKKKASTARTTSGASSSTRAKKSTANS